MDVKTLTVCNAVVAEETLQLHPYKAIWWPANKALILADLHLGKTTHFRKAGIAVPLAASEDNWNRLDVLFQEFQPEQVFLLGDLFHSDHNGEWELFQTFLQSVPQVRVVLIEGNHDKRTASWHEAAVFEVVPQWQEGPFLMTHHPLEKVPERLYNLCGHIHPAVQLRGQGRQKLHLPCFYFGKEQGILPAFGAFTGTSLVEPQPGDQVFLIAGGSVVAP